MTEHEHETMGIFADNTFGCPARDATEQLVSQPVGRREWLNQDGGALVFQRQPSCEHGTWAQLHVELWEMAFMLYGNGPDGDYRPRENAVGLSTDTRGNWGAPCPRPDCQGRITIGTVAEMQRVVEETCREGRLVEALIARSRGMGDGARSSEIVGPEPCLVVPGDRHPLLHPGGHFGHSRDPGEWKGPFETEGACIDDALESYGSDAFVIARGEVVEGRFLPYGGGDTFGTPWIRFEARDEYPEEDDDEDEGS